MTKRCPEIIEKILDRFANGEPLNKICNAQGEYPDQSRFWAWRKNDPDLQREYQDALLRNVEAMLQRSEDLMEAAQTRDEILKADKTLNHYRWKAEKLLAAFKPENKTNVELSGAVGQFSIGWADEDQENKPQPEDVKQRIDPVVSERENRAEETQTSRA